VPAIAIGDFRRSYEFITDNVIPYSAKQLKIPEKDGLTIWYIFAYVGRSISSTSRLMRGTMTTRTTTSNQAKNKSDIPLLLPSLSIRRGTS
jgi:hypothetical protein